MVAAAVVYESLSGTEIRIELGSKGLDPTLERCQRLIAVHQPILEPLPRIEFGGFRLLSREQLFARNLSARLSG